MSRPTKRRKISCGFDECTDSGVYSLKHDKSVMFCGTHKSEKMCHYESKICKDHLCTQTASFNFVGEKTRLYCAIHKLVGMINVTYKPCLLCHLKPAFNFPKLSPMYCNAHKKDGMVNVITRKCETCGRVASFNVPGAMARYCKKHAKVDMIYVKGQRCEKCHRLPYYNHPGTTSCRLCHVHKEVGMINIQVKRCEKCRRSAAFNIPGAKLRRFCKEHKEPGMVNIASKRCESCSKIPVFNIPGSKEGRFCLKHKNIGMVDVVSRRCEKCDRHPNFNQPMYKIGRFCDIHKDPGMVSVTTKRCETCTHSALFNRPGLKSGRFCDEHKQHGMINVKSKKCDFSGGCLKVPWHGVAGGHATRCAEHKDLHMVPLTKRCNFAGGCMKNPTYGFPGQSPLTCAEHHSAGMLFKPKRRCQECDQPALYGMCLVPEFCEHHKSPEHMNLVQQECKICVVLDVVDEEGKCARCSDYLSRRVYLRKQKLVKRWLDWEDDLKHHVYDRALDGPGCSKERPDFVWELPTHSVILEVDEEQHRDRPCECEQVRMINLTQAKQRPCIWLRYNPDAYKGGTTTDRVRREFLVNVLRACFKSKPHSPAETCRVLHLYFDGFKPEESMKMVNLPMP